MVQCEDIYELQARWPKLSTVVKYGYCPYGQHKLLELIKSGDIDGGQLDDGNKTWFVDRQSLDKHMEQYLINREQKILKANILANMRRHGL
jgi:hypothetical protein